MASFVRGAPPPSLEQLVALQDTTFADPPTPRVAPTPEDMPSVARLHLQNKLVLLDAQIRDLQEVKKKTVDGSALYNMLTPLGPNGCYAHSAYVQSTIVAPTYSLRCRIAKQLDETLQSLEKLKGQAQELLGSALKQLEDAKARQPPPTQNQKRPLASVNVNQQQPPPKKQRQRAQPQQQQLVLGGGGQKKQTKQKKQQQTKQKKQQQRKKKQQQRKKKPTPAPELPALPEVEPTLPPELREVFVAAGLDLSTPAVAAIAKALVPLDLALDALREALREQQQQEQQQEEPGKTCEDDEGDEDDEDEPPLYTLQGGLDGRVLRGLFDLWQDLVSAGAHAHKIGLPRLQTNRYAWWKKTDAPTPTTEQEAVAKKLLREMATAIGFSEKKVKKFVAAKAGVMPWHAHNPDDGPLVLDRLRLLSVRLIHLHNTLGRLQGRWLLASRSQWLKAFAGPPGNKTNHLGWAIQAFEKLPQEQAATLGRALDAATGCDALHSLDSLYLD